MDIHNVLQYSIICDHDFRTGYPIYMKHALLPPHRCVCLHARNVGERFARTFVLGACISIHPKTRGRPVLKRRMNTQGTATAPIPYSYIIHYEACISPSTYTRSIPGMSRATTRVRVTRSIVSHLHVLSKVTFWARYRAATSARLVKYLVPSLH